MKKISECRYILLLGGVFILSSVLYGQTKELLSLTFMPQWTPQTQFAGYYAAYEKGFYNDEGIDLKIEHLPVYSSSSVIEQLLSGKVQVVTQQLLQSIVNRSKGIKIVNLLQTSQNCGLMCVSHKPIASLQSLDGLKVGRWKAGYSELCDMVVKENRLQIEWIPFLQNINLYISGAIDATLCYSYNEYLRLLLALGSIPAENTLLFSEIGYNYPEDGIYVTEEFYNRNKEMLRHFVKASIRGWEYAREHPDEALAITLEYARRANIATSTYHQRLMLDEVLRLQQNEKRGKADYKQIGDSLFNEIVSKMQKENIISRPVTYKELIK